MKLLPIVSVVVGATASVFGQTIALGAPADGDMLYQGESFTAQVIQPGSPIRCTQVGIALAVAHCTDGVCPEPSERLGDVLYAGPWNPTSHPDGFYQNFTLNLPEYDATGPAIFTLTHLCLLGAGPIPLLEYRNASVTVE
ncbi:hypothetical protein L210DRAFT_3763744 [Boletus edulis BED1]|uniref:Uncharacterized protein n=1 Tax=Boletus edulis BED1 TaxID=1328754 RepID=A0AAD4BKY6_BOLED|nr:hypothetical protein L210DRAFT_3763744 [Boletus edulis BED1]